MDFPQYRKLDGFGRYYKILDERTFIEIAFVGGKPAEQRIEAKQYPEMVRIQDMLACEWSFSKMEAEEITAYFGNHG